MIINHHHRTTATMPDTPPLQTTTAAAKTKTKAQAQATPKQQNHEEWSNFQQKHRKVPSTAEKFFQPVMDAINLDDLFVGPSVNATLKPKNVGKGQLPGQKR